MVGPDELVSETARALGFLSRIPMPARFFVGHDGSMRTTSGTFAVAGALIALPPALLFGIFLYFGVKAELAALLSLALQILLTGGLHEDGLADCADGLGGGRTRERMLEIMKDSRLGAYGGLALILSLGLRTEALAGIASLGPLAAGLAMVGINAASRAALVWHWSALPPARADGVAAAVGQPDAAALKTALITGGLIYALTILPGLGAGPAIAGAIVAGLAIALFTRLVHGKIQGHTGDTLGATEQICEIALCVALAVAV
ncbi:adenosylcobinamide-GDP ribazoletransferase [Rhizobium sp. C4]|uniref:adenosylcobinamide-GDP ribazoletransferase n=1 Tax=Rhizobium sp. C4 TaxID=1349800 RepID=UPI001E3AA6CF|nr:adenosylcobinamide-GDP ribazoletransferase [Rhizobium sp. C4]MCD2171591.1 adenosylcobinamide-GDP ribazoletransferase [Rhizobium sp. C4]